MKIVATQEEVKSCVTVDEYIGLMENNIRTIVDVMSRFLIDDDGNKIPYKEARAFVGKQTIEEMERLAAELTKALDQGATNPPRKEA